MFNLGDIRRLKSYLCTLNKITMSFISLGLSPALLKALEGQNYTQPYPIQKEAIPAILKGKNVLGIAQTGSGKTAGYVLPVLMNLQEASASKKMYIKV